MSIRATVIIITGVAVAVLVGCNQSSTPAAPDADFFVGEGQGLLLRVGETVGVQTSSAIVIVRFNDVLGDSRCPVDVTCVDAGQASVQLAVQTALSIQDVVIEVPPDGRASARVEEVLIEILRLDPAAVSGTTISLLDYEVGLRVTEVGDLGVPVPQ